MNISWNDLQSASTSCSEAAGLLREAAIYGSLDGLEHDHRMSMAEALHALSEAATILNCELVPVGRVISINSEADVGRAA